MGTENKQTNKQTNKKTKKKENKKKTTHSCVRREIILVELYWEQSSTALKQRIPLFYLKFILAESWAGLMSFISDFTPYGNISFFKKHEGN